MNEEILALFIPIIFLLIVGGLIALRMLKPYGNRILDLIEEMGRSRRSILAEQQTLQRIEERIDLLAERQDFLESLVEGRLRGEDQDARSLPREGGGPGDGPATGGSGTGAATAGAHDADGEASRG